MTKTNDEQNGNEYESKLYDHPVYSHYQDIHAKHVEENPLSGQIDENLLSNFSGDVLAGENKINLRSKSLFVVDDKFLSLFDDIGKLLDGDKNLTYTFFHLGSSLSGHTSIVHGGLLATLLDELTCRLGFQNYHSKRAVTANLNISYYKPCHTDSFVMIKCTVIKKEGRKCWVKGEVYHLDLDGELEVDKIETKDNLLSGCECLIVEPKWAIE